MRGRYDDYRGGRRERSRSRSNSRERKRNRDEYRGGSRHGHPSNSASTNPYANQYVESSGYNNWNAAPESSTICIKGLPTHTTEPTLYAVLAPYYPKEIRLMTERSGECKGFAFVEFVTLEHAQYFMMTFAGSHGDRHAPQFIVENRAVLLEYAREKPPSTYEPKHGGASGGEYKKSAPRSDWMCTNCSCHNFAKRDTCFKCESSRTDSSISVPSDNHAQPAVISEAPSPFLVVRGFNPYISELQVAELFRQYSVVKNVVILKDPSTNYSKGLAFVEFPSVQYASFALQNGQSLYIDAILLKVSYAKETVMHQLIQQSKLPGSQLLVNPLAAAAMQSAQWSSGAGGFGAAVPAVSHSAHSSSLAPTATTAVTSAAPKAKSKFPLQFETHGGAYVFQTKSGCFLDPVNEFFYCTRAKLYYSARDGTYYTFDQGADPPYKRFDPPLPIEPETSSSGEDAASSSAAAAAPASLSVKDTTVRLPVSMSLGGGGAVGGSSGGGFLKMKNKIGGAGGGSAALGKKVLENMAKWGALQEDDEDDPEEGTASGAATASASVSDAKPVKSASSAAAVPAGAISSAGAPVLTNSELGLLQKTSSPPVAVKATTTSATPAPAAAPAAAASSTGFVCLLCRRQFNSAEMLGKHERESKLHADNLKAQQAAAAAEKASPPPALPAAPQYRDRAAERRERVGGADSPPRSSSDANQHTDSTLSYGPSFTAFASSGGGSVSSGFSYSAAAAAAVPPPQPPRPPLAVFEDASNPGNAILRRMGWSDGSGLGKDGSGKEEAVGVELANNRATAGSGPLVYAMGSGYRDTARNAMRARFDQLQNNK